MNIIFDMDGFMAPDKEIMKVIVAQYDNLEQIKAVFGNGDL